MSKHSEQVMKSRAKLKRVEVLISPEDYAALRAAAASFNLSIAALIKIALGFVNKEEEND